METFNDIINGDKPVLVDFYATWCAPCKSMAPIVDSLAKELAGTVRVLKIDVDKNQAVASHYGVQAVPTFIIFKGGKIVWKHPGGIDKTSLKQQMLSFV